MGWGGGGGAVGEEQIMKRLRWSGGGGGGADGIKVGMAGDYLGGRGQGEELKTLSGGSCTDRWAGGMQEERNVTAERKIIQSTCWQQKNHHPCRLPPDQWDLMSTCTMQAESSGGGQGEDRVGGGQGDVGGQVGGPGPLRLP